MKEIEFIKFRKISYHISFIVLIIFLGLMLQVHPSLFDSLQIPFPMSFLKPFIREIMFVVGLSFFFLRIYFYNNRAISLIIDFLSAFPIFILTRSFYIEGLLFEFLIFGIWFILGILLFIIHFLSQNLYEKVLPYWNHLLSSLMFGIPGMFLLLVKNNLLNIDLEFFTIVDINPFFIIIISLLIFSNLLVTVYNKEFKRLTIKHFLSIIIILFELAFFYIHLNKSSIIIDAIYLIMVLWILIYSIFEDRDFKLNG